MSESVTLPALGESVTEGTVTRWLKKVGDRVEVDEPLLEVSTDKVDTEIPSPVAGVIESILVQEDETVEVGAVLVTIGDGSGAAAPAEAPAAPAEAAPAEAAPAPVEAPAAPSRSPPRLRPNPLPLPSRPPRPPSRLRRHPRPSRRLLPSPSRRPRPLPSPSRRRLRLPSPLRLRPRLPPRPPLAPAAAGANAHAGYVTPIVRKLANEKGIDLGTVTGTGVGGRIRKQDVLAAGSPAVSTSAPAAQAAPVLEVSPLRGTTVPMSRLRKVVAERAVLSMTTLAPAHHGRRGRRHPRRQLPRRGQGGVPGQDRPEADLPAVLRARRVGGPQGVPDHQRDGRRRQHRLPRSREREHRGRHRARPADPGRAQRERAQHRPARDRDRR